MMLSHTKIKNNSNNKSVSNNAYLAEKKTGKSSGICIYIYSVREMFYLEKLIQFSQVPYESRCVSIPIILRLNITDLRS